MLCECTLLVVIFPCRFVLVVCLTKLRIYYKDVQSQDSVVGIATGYGLDDRGVGVRVPVGSRIFSSRRLDRLLGPTQLSIQW
jgi:hypothetical protein